jgi:endonuclease/exonuclease/phosphatase family metal-dependent hydrolase
MRIISLNIEERRRLGLVRPFFEQAQANVLCLQEIMEKDVPLFEQQLGMRAVFAPMKHLQHESGTADRKGVAIFTTGEILATEIIYYSAFLPGPELKIDPELIVANHCALLFMRTRIDDALYSVATTHFMWAPGGNVAPPQLDALERLMATLDRYPDVILTGDFNCPRGKTIFDTLADRYTDNIPASVQTTIDGNFHRAGSLDLVVDGLFTSDHYTVQEVVVHDGLSDHCAVSGIVTRNA